MSYAIAEGQKVAGEWCAFTTSTLLKLFKIDLLCDVTLSVQCLGLHEQKGAMPRGHSW